MIEDWTLKIPSPRIPSVGVRPPAGGRANLCLPKNQPKEGTTMKGRPSRANFAGLLAAALLPMLGASVLAQHVLPPLPYAEDAIYRRISDITISMKSTDHLKMPELISTQYEVALSDAERDRYENLKQELILQLPDGEITAANAAALTGKLSQLANGAIYSDTGEIMEFHDRKLDALEDIIEAANEKPLLVAYWFRHDLARIKNRFNVREIKTSRDIADWNAGKIPVAVIHPASAGHGLNLQAGGSTLVWFGLTWSLELYQQTNARLWRQGQQSHTVVIQHIITKGTIDERILKALSKKELTQSALIDAVKVDLEVPR